MAKKLSRKALAERLGISDRAVYGLQRLGMPTDSVAAARRWRSRNVSSAKGGSNLNQLRGDLIARRAELLGIEVAIRRRELVDVAEIERKAVAAVGACRTKLLGTSRRLRARFRDADEALLAAVDQLAGGALDDLAAAFERLAESEGA